MNPAQGAVASPSRRTSFMPSVVSRHEQAIRRPRRESAADSVDVSIVIPVFNERENMRLLMKRIEETMEPTGFSYELLFIDDHSTDRSVAFIRSLGDERVRILQNRGRSGKSSSLLLGFRAARGNAIVMIDGDLQYPPEAIPAMLDALEFSDIVIANRKQRHTSRLRSSLSRVYQRFFCRHLLHLRVDVQSGLKAFRPEILPIVRFNPSPWGFDGEFLYQAVRKGYRLSEVDIVFDERRHGKSHVRPLRTGLELIWGAVKLRLRSLPEDLLPFFYYPHASEYHTRGFENTDDYLFLPEIESARRHLYVETVSLFLFSALVGVLLLRGITMLTGIPSLLILSGLVACIYLSLIIFKVRIVLTSARRDPLKFSDEEIAAIRDDDLPVYTIIIPLYQEADVIPQIMKAMSSIDYPTDKLDVIITLEAYDHETKEAIDAAHPPAYFRTLILPDVVPKTKPKALNVAFLEAKGEFLVIYDAEIVPDGDQLKKAYLAFRRHRDIACLQTYLDHYNANQNWLTRLFNAEFSFHYDLFLPGLQHKDYALPLSGHSTHFRSNVLAKVGAWDPYNLTEDCDIGIRLFRKGYRTDIIDSHSTEEATSTVGAWIAQRSRWMKGFIQTSIVHLRHPIRLKKELGSWTKFAIFLIVVPGSVLMNILNLFYWALLGMWVFTRSAEIQALFPGPVLYVSIFCFAVGNFLFMYLNLLGLYRRQRYGLVKYGLLFFFYWLMLGYAAVRACVHLIAKPYQWEKTKHGKHLLLPSYETAALLP
jgi:cellulose synthase/poly-beta-1,6-N-acetylglucosamine synthase-like glycosyltransferase